MTYSIRRAGLQDVDRLVPLFDGYRRFYGQPSDLIAARRFIGDRLARGQSVVWIAEDHDGKMIGFVQLFPTFSSVLVAPMYVLSDLFVMPAARRCGVGTRLLHAAVEAARAAGAARLELATAVDNMAAQRLYESLGWKRDNEFYQYGLSV